ncbi:hypothetical protein [Thaumasiovibrio sp. DFM-14]|uniref:hypothetical protein n=1 Tax=Thaumasiovibrio sp. DFM-14 TaxID=3384792 RepID=UPI0039A1C293
MTDTSKQETKLEQDKLRQARFRQRMIDNGLTRLTVPLTESAHIALTLICDLTSKNRKEALIAAVEAHPNGIPSIVNELDKTVEGKTLAPQSLFVPPAVSNAIVKSPKQPKYLALAAFVLSYAKELGIDITSTPEKG